LECARLLLPVSNPTAGGNTILLAAVLSGNHNSVDLLYNLCDVNRVLEILKTCHMDRTDEWFWFQELIDTQRVRAVLHSHVEAAVSVTTITAPKKM